MIDGGVTATGGQSTGSYADIFDAVFGASARKLVLRDSGDVLAQLSAGQGAGVGNDGIVWAPADTLAVKSTVAPASSMAASLVLVGCGALIFFAWKSGAFR